MFVLVFEYFKTNIDILTYKMFNQINVYVYHDSTHHTY